MDCRKFRIVPNLSKYKVGVQRVHGRRDLHRGLPRTKIQQILQSACQILPPSQKFAVFI